MILALLDILRNLMLNQYVWGNEKTKLGKDKIKNVLQQPFLVILSIYS